MIVLIFRFSARPWMAGGLRPCPQAEPTPLGAQHLLPGQVHPGTGASLLGATRARRSCRQCDVWFPCADAEHLGPFSDTSFSKVSLGWKLFEMSGSSSSSARMELQQDVANEGSYILGRGARGEVQSRRTAAPAASSELRPP